MPKYEHGVHASNLAVQFGMAKSKMYTIFKKIPLCVGLEAIDN